MNLIKHFKLSAFLLIGLFAISANTVSAQNKDLSKQTKITMEQARATAMTKASGTIEGEELEKENGKLVYSFDIRNAKGTITEVQVDAKTGKIVSVEEENAEKEAAEKRQEMAEKKQKSGDDDDEETSAMKQANMAKYSKEAKITLEQAKAIALKRIPGEITDADLEKERGKLQYAFDIKSPDGKVYDVEVDAKSGKILKAVLDTEDDEDEDN
ncbi:MAG: PepSY domain-containing protein [Pyrinomonadaceae bacterium]